MEGRNEGVWNEGYGGKRNEGMEGKKKGGMRGCIGRGREGGGAELREGVALDSHASVQVGHVQCTRSTTQSDMAVLKAGQVHILTSNFIRLHEKKACISCGEPHPPTPCY
jgi:hypothetical protein